MKPRTTRRATAVGLASLLLALVSAQVFAAAGEGATIYAAKCKACHGVSGQGDTPMGKKLSVKDLASPEAQKLSDDEMFELIQKGKNRMPAFEKQLAPEKIRQVVVYVRTLARS